MAAYGAPPAGQNWWEGNIFKMPALTGVDTRPTWQAAAAQSASPQAPAATPSTPYFPSDPGGDAQRSGPGLPGNPGDTTGNFMDQALTYGGNIASFATGPGAAMLGAAGNTLRGANPASLSLLSALGIDIGKMAGLNGGQLGFASLNPQQQAGAMLTNPAMADYLGRSTFGDLINNMDLVGRLGGAFEAQDRVNSGNYNPDFEDTLRNIEREFVNPQAGGPGLSGPSFADAADRAVESGYAS